MTLYACFARWEMEMEEREGKMENDISISSEGYGFPAREVNVLVAYIYSC
jgi:hypothetical protein